MQTEGLQATEAECAKGRTAPRVSLQDIEGAINHSFFLTASEAVTGIPGREMGSVAELDVLALCILVLFNGFTIIGKSAPASPENFDSALGQKLAYEDAVRQIWPLMGFALKDRMHRDANEPEARPEDEAPFDTEPVAEPAVAT